MSSGPLALFFDGFGIVDCHASDVLATAGAGEFARSLRMQAERFDEAVEALLVVRVDQLRKRDNGPKPAGEYFPAYAFAG